MKPQLDFETVVAAATAGEEAARDELVAFTYRWGYNALRKQFPNAESDLLWNAVVEVVSRVASLELLQNWSPDRSTFLTFLTACLRNEALNELKRDMRRRRAERTVPVEEIDERHESGGPSPERYAAAEQKLARIWPQLTAREQRICLAMLQGLPLAEIARREDTSVGAIKSAVHEIRRRVRGLH